MDLALIVKVTIALVVGLTAAVIARRARASVRHVILAATFAALLVLPAMPSVLPARVAVPSARTALTAVVPDVSVRQAAIEVVERLSPPPSRQPQASGSRVPITTWLTLAWAAGFLLLAGSLVAALVRLRALRRTGIPWDEGQHTLDVLAHECGLGIPVEVLRHDAIGAPVTWGVRRPVVLVPADATEWDARDLRQAFLHELEHVHRRDWIVQVLARSICAVYWFHPLVWIAWRQLCLESERSCDDAVLRRANGTDYAQQLVSLAQRVSLASSVPMLSMASRSDLSVRVRALLDTTVGRGRAGGRTLLIAAVLATVIVVALSPLRAAQPIAAADEPVDTARAMAAATLLDTTIDALEMKAERLQDTVVDSLRGRAQRPSNRDVIEAFLESAGDGNISEVEAFLASGMDVNTVLIGDGTALMAAAESGKLEMVRLLIARGADVDLPAKGDGNPLIVASRSGRRAVVEYLLDRNANPNAVVEGDGSPLVVAARRGDLAMVTLLVERGADVNLAARGDGNPLIMASDAGHLDVVRYLLDRGANVDAMVEGDENPLINAAAEGHLDVARLLVARGANVNAGVTVNTTFQVGNTYRTVPEYRSPLSMATKYGHKAMIEFLRANGAVR